MSRFQEFSVRPADPFHPHSRRQRALTGILFCVFALGLLGSAFFRTQILRNDEFLLRADDNRFDIVPIAAPRGTVFDRNGKIVAETVTGYALLVEPGPADSVRARVSAVAGLLRLDTATIEAAVRASATSRGKPVMVSRLLTFEQVSKLEERNGRIHGLVLQPYPVRRYPAGPAVAHVVGYVLEINDRELQSKEFQGYRQGQHIGKTGIERQYEASLGGTMGAQYVEVDARGRVLGRFAPTVSDPPEPGKDLKLTLDLDLQRYAHQVFPAGMRGAVVAMVPSTGEILAMYSAPAYDPNLFVGGVSGADWTRLNEDPARPRLNRALAGTYPPASTWKLATAIAALERGVMKPADVMPIPCVGGMAYAGRYSRCMKREGHGPQDLTRAIANSCNVYFYQLGIRLGLENLTSAGTRLGFGRATGVDLPGERVGTFPSGRDWYVRRFGWRPPPSEVMNLAIGQGPNSQTPLRMAQFYSALAGGGVARRPHMLMGSDAPVETDLGVSGETLGSLWQGLAAVIEAGGTAHAVELRRFKLYGKTGTSQNSADPTKDHA